MEIKVVKNPPKGVTALLEGKLDSAASSEAEKSFVELMDKEKGLKLDFTDLTYISSAGLRVLLVLQKKANMEGLYFAVTGVNAVVDEVFEMTGFKEVLNIE